MFKMANLLPLPPKPSHLQSKDTLTSNGNCWQLSLVLNDSTHMSLDTPSLSTQTTSHLSRFKGRPWQMHQCAFNGCSCDSKDMTAPSCTTLERRCFSLIPFQDMLHSAPMSLNWMSQFIMCTLGTHTRPHYRNSPGLTHF